AAAIKSARESIFIVRSLLSVNRRIISSPHRGASLLGLYPSGLDDRRIGQANLVQYATHRLPAKAVVINRREDIRGHELGAVPRDAGRFQDPARSVPGPAF